MDRRTDIVARAVWAEGLFPHQFAWLIDNPLRRLIISPKQLADRLPLRDDAVVLEVGPGSGYFSVELARRIPRGVLHLVDVQPEMLAKARKKLAAHGLRNVQYAAADAGAGLPFRRAHVDVAVLVSVLGEVANRSGCLSALFHVLRPGGTLAIHESMPDPDRITFRDLVNIVERGGFHIMLRQGHSYNYTALFRRP